MTHSHLLFDPEGTNLIHIPELDCLILSFNIVQSFIPDLILWGWFFDLVIVPALSSDNDSLTARFKGFDHSYQLLWTVISGDLCCLTKSCSCDSACQHFFQLISVICPRIPPSPLSDSSQILSVSHSFVPPHNDISDHTMDTLIIRSYHCLFHPFLCTLSFGSDPPFQ